MFDDNKKRYREFCRWQKMPHHVKPMSQEEHVCPTCGRRFKGNYCPQCGQSSMIGRYSFRNAFLLFVDVWGLGNRGMFRSLRDLLLRPGYMIRDYLRGMQMAYFPPFKMFFLLFALSLVVNSGLNIQGEDRLKSQKEQIETYFDGKLSELEADKADKKPKAEKKEENIEDKVDKEAKRLQDAFGKWTEGHDSYVQLFLLLVYAWPLWLLIRHCPAIPDLRYSECLLAMVYVINMLTIYSLIPAFFCFGMKAEVVFILMTTLLMIVPVKQLSGYSYLQTVWRMLLALIPFCFLILGLFIAQSIAFNLYAYIKFG